MEYDFEIQKIDNSTVKLIGPNLSPWQYCVRLGSKWHNVFIENNICKFNRDIDYYFKEVDNGPPIIDLETKEEIPKKYTCKVSIDLFELKKLQKIDKINPGYVEPMAPMMPEDNERMSKLEEEIKLKTKQLHLVSSKLDNLENLLKKSLGL